MVNIFTKSKNRGNFAALLNVELFDKDTRKDPMCVEEAKTNLAEKRINWIPPKLSK